MAIPSVCMQLVDAMARSKGALLSQMHICTNPEQRGTALWNTLVKQKLRDMSAQ